jgi:hypothetical protein
MASLTDEIQARRTQKKEEKDLNHRPASTCITEANNDRRNRANVNEATRCDGVHRIVTITRTHVGVLNGSGDGRFCAWKKQTRKPLSKESDTTATAEFVASAGRVMLTAGVGGACAARVQCGGRGGRSR